jgi:hypothetical protein
MPGYRKAHEVSSEEDEECDVGGAWTDVLSNKNLLELKKQCDGAKRRKNLMNCIPCATR